jgi:hypothetical protein
MSGDTVLHVTYEQPGEDLALEEHTSRENGLGTTSETAQSGSQAGYAFLDAGDAYNAGGPRSEWKSDYLAELGREYWYQLSIYVPEAWNDQGRNRNWGDYRILFQFHEAGSVTWSPIYAIRIQDSGRGDRIYFYRKDGENGPLAELWQQRLVTETWMDFAINVKWSTERDGFIRFYKDGRLLYSATGIATLNDGNYRGPYAKWGIYGQPGLMFFDDVSITLVPGS